MRTSYSKAIHSSIKKQLDKIPAGKRTPEVVAEAARKAYSRVRTEPGPKDTGPRK